MKPIDCAAAVVGGLPLLSPIAGFLQHSDLRERGEGNAAWIHAMVMVHISSLARNNVLSEVCDTLRAADIEYSLTPLPSPQGRWLGEGLPEAIAASSAFIHVEDVDSFWSTALLQEAELAFLRRSADPGYAFLIVRVARSDPSRAWAGHYFPAATVIYVDESGWKEALVKAVNEARPHS